MGKIIGIGTGRGIGLMFILMGLIIMLITMLGYYYPPLRKVEIELPDAT
ncbi:MAG: hypothetical protein HC836_20700 [Richelia sp. RM2_1_2]|nr:hypothetical protein [Richelia sp. SM2_1_7]NJM17727.1 hypothetical protein [Richelia sp. SM1_7_0]NJN08224.1 hypothetical protein [Richelia sp. RM1_1_1]NJO28051.1 hypothetical protein [Richelia sp. SL_2_1]NJO60593.1 hypothetical protein [Richelia sp. RM2_1_2]